MLFRTKTLLWACASALLWAGGAQADDCTDGPMESTTSVGTDGGIGFCFTKWKDGLVVTGIEAWTITQHIKAIRLTYSDGTKNLVGPENSADSRSGSHVTLSWGKDETITNMKMAFNKDSNALGHLSFEVGGKKFSIESDYRWKEMKTVNLGSGIMLGASGNGGGYVQKFTPLFLGTLSGEATVVDMKFDQDLEVLNQQQNGIEEMILGEIFIENSNPVGTTGMDSAYIFGVDVTRQMTITDSTTKTHTFGTEISAKFGGKVGIPLLAEGSVEFGITAKYQYETAATHTTADAKTVTFKFTQQSTKDTDFVRPGFAKHCKAYAYQGHYSGDYTKSIEITVSGRKFTFLQRGSMETISFTKAQGGCKDVPISEVPSGANRVEAKDTLNKQNNAGGTNNQPLNNNGAPVKRAISFTA